MTASRKGDNERIWYEHWIGDALMPLGGYSTDSMDACGDFNVPPSIERVRNTLQEVYEAGPEPESLYRRALELYARLSRDRRRGHPEWDWPAPSYEDSGPATWQPLTHERLTRIHALRVVSVLAGWRGVDRAEWLSSLRAVLERAAARNANPRTVYGDALADYYALRHDDEQSPPPAPDYADVAPHGHSA